MRFRQPQKSSRAGKSAWPRDLSKPPAFWAKTAVSKILNYATISFR